MADKKKEDVISNPNHYKLDGLDIEVRDVIKSVLGTVAFHGFYEGNIIKYILRAKKKNGLEDYKKAKQYLDWLIEELDEDANVDGQLSYLEDGELDPEESEELNRLNKKLMNTVGGLTEEEQGRHVELISKKYGTIEEDEMQEKLTPEEEKEFAYLDKKVLSTMLTVTKAEMERHAELATKKYGTEEDIRERHRRNRENFLKLQEKVNERFTK